MWIGTETVESYHAIMVLTGTESYKVYPRRQASHAGPLAISPNSRILAVVRLIQPVQLTRTKVAWMMDCYKVRKGN